jgi:hypothetical protein
MKADMNNATSLQRTLDTGLLRKFRTNGGSIFFLPNTNSLLTAEICEALHIDTEALSDKYLGFQLLLVRIGVIASNIL